MRVRWAERESFSLSACGVCYIREIHIQKSWQHDFVIKATEARSETNILYTKLLTLCEVTSAFPDFCFWSSRTHKNCELYSNSLWVGVVTEIPHRIPLLYVEFNSSVLSICWWWQDFLNFCYRIGNTYFIWFFFESKISIMHYAW